MFHLSLNCSNVPSILTEKRRKIKNLNKFLTNLKAYLLAVKKIACYNISDVEKLFMMSKFEVSPAEIVG
jgi:hypothetical protein